jgi:predicted metal-dependent phosphoesterase TrpH
MVERLIELGHPITLERVQEICGGGSLGRPHLARALVECGSVASIDAAFDELLSPGKPGYVDVARIESEEAIALIHRAGGFASVAHAAVYADGDAVIDALIGAGLDGIEVFHPDVDAEHADRYLALAVQHGLVVTGGSDYHGFEGSRHIGEVMLPEPYTARFVERLRG